MMINKHVSLNQSKIVSKIQPGEFFPVGSNGRTSSEIEVAETAPRLRHRDLNHQNRHHEHVNLTK
jgi:hypothetical protein